MLNWLRRARADTACPGAVSDCDNTGTARQVTRDEIEFLFAEEFGDLPLRCRHRKCTSCVRLDRMKAARGGTLQTMLKAP